jgi:kynurenine 3-monooxygenase
MKTPTITIVGAGLAGPLLGISLVQRGFSVVLYERRPDMRRFRVSAGRSINLAVSTRGIHALQEAGVWQRLQKIIIPMRGRMMHSVTGELTFQRYGKDDTEVINSVSRAELNIALLNAAESAGVTICFNQRCTGYDMHGGTVRLHMHDEETDSQSVVEAELAIGADGSASAIRQDMVKSTRFNFCQDYLNYGYKELTIPAGPDSRHQLEINALHIWPRGAYMLIALPNIDGTFGCILFLPFEGENSFAGLDTESKVLEFFRTRFPDALALMPQLAENYFANPTGAMVTIKCFPWHQVGKVVLLGDAAHAIVPFFGQGINCGFEDCTCLLEMLDRAGSTSNDEVDWQRLFTEFELSRKPNTDAIADLALENFVEMRDRVADPHFLFRKKVELALEARFPHLFVPKYAMVTFHRVPYSVALERGRIQDRMLAELCHSVDRLEDLDWSKVEMLVHRDLTPLGDV